MRIFGMTMENPASRKIMSYVGPDETVNYTGVRGEAEIAFDDVFLMYRDSAQNFRPYLLMDGHVLAFKPTDKDFSPVLGPTEAVSFGSDSPKRCIFEYNFSDEEIKQLIDLGFYNKGFRVPDIFTKETFELPVGGCDITVIPPDSSKPRDAANPPLVIADMGDMSMTVIDGTTSGYENLARYFQPAEERYTNVAYEDIAEAEEDIRDDVQEQSEETYAPDAAAEPDVDITEFEGVAQELPKTEEEIEADMYAALQGMRGEDGRPSEEAEQPEAASDSAYDSIVKEALEEDSAQADEPSSDSMFDNMFKDAYTEEVAPEEESAPRPERKFVPDSEQFIDFGEAQKNEDSEEFF